jgi:hypothetical protein
MLSKIKKAGIYACIIIFCSIGMFVSGYYYCNSNKKSVQVATNGTIIQPIKINYTNIFVSADNPCLSLVLERNSILDEYTRFLGSKPIVYATEKNKIMFRIAEQKYSIEYKIPEDNWTLTPIIYTRVNFAQTFFIAYGGACIFEHSSGFGGMLAMDNSPSIAIGVSWRGFKF